MRCSQVFKQVLIGFLLMTLLVACKEEQPKQKNVVKLVKTMLVSKQLSGTMRYFPGTVLASTRAELAFKVPGQVVKLPILEGKSVEKDQLLAQLDDSKYKDEANEAKARYERAKAEYRRAAELVKKGYVSRSDYDTKEAQFKVGEANLNTAMERLRDASLRAPFKGVIAKRYIDNYENIQAKQPILSLQHVGFVDIKINVPEGIILNIKRAERTDNEPDIVAVFDAAPGKSYPVKIKEFSTDADPETQTYSIVFKMSAPKDINVLSGMTVTIKALLPDSNSQGGKYYLIPSSAVFVNEANQSMVWRIDPKTFRLNMTPIQATRLAGDKIRVISGLKAGDRIVVAGVHFLHQDQKVKIMSDDAQGSK